MRERIDYDRVAEGYDAQPYRSKSADPDLLAFAAARPGVPLAVADLACGTGNQLLADLEALPTARYVGVDRSLGMLRVARRKSPRILWVRGEVGDLPLATGTIDYATCQYAFHHVPRKERALAEVRRALAPGGRFVLSNIRPEAMEGALFYRFFPAARERDRVDFPPLATLATWFAAAGFRAVDTRETPIRWETTLGEFLARCRRRTDCSQLAAIDDADYEAGLAAIERAIAASPTGAATALRDEVALVEIAGDR